MSMTRRTRGVLILAGAALCLAAYVSASYILSPAVIDSGGGHATSSSYQADASIGGAVIAPVAAGGEASSANYKLEVGSVGVLTKGVQDQPAPGGGGGCVPCAGSAVSLAALPALLVCLARRRRRG